MVRRAGRGDRAIACGYLLAAVMMVQYCGSKWMCGNGVVPAIVGGCHVCCSTPWVRPGPCVPLEVGSCPTVGWGAPGVRRGVSVTGLQDCRPCYSGGLPRGLQHPVGKVKSLCAAEVGSCPTVTRGAPGVRRGAFVLLAASHTVVGCAAPKATKCHPSIVSTLQPTRSHQ